MKEHQPRRDIYVLTDIIIKFITRMVVCKMNIFANIALVLVMMITYILSLDKYCQDLSETDNDMDLWTFDEFNDDIDDDMDSPYFYLIPIVLLGLYFYEFL